MIHVIIINGYPESGKDTFVELCGKYTPVFNIVTSDPMKQALKLLGWDGTKTPEARKALADLKQTANELFGTTLNYVTRRVHGIAMDFSEGIIFIHSREPEEIETFKLLFKAETLFMKRDNPNRVLTNSSDAGVEKYSYDIVIDNNGTLEELEEKAKNFVLIGDV